MDFQVVEADPSDPIHACAIVELLDEYASSPMGGSQPLSSFEKANLANELAKRSTAHVVLAFSNGDPAGLIVAFEGFSTFQCRPLLNLHDITVSEKYRRRGLSKLLMEKVEAVARRLGCCKLTLEVLEGNAIAQAAYHSLGFHGYELDPATGQALFWEKKLG